jgi:hypothetical protein
MRAELAPIFMERLRIDDEPDDYDDDSEFDEDEDDREDADDEEDEDDETETWQVSLHTRCR